MNRGPWPANSLHAHISRRHTLSPCASEISGTTLPKSCLRSDREPLSPSSIPRSESHSSHLNAEAATVMEYFPLSPLQSSGLALNALGAKEVDSRDKSRSLTNTGGGGRHIIQKE
jgi:hypothetical protein